MLLYCIYQLAQFSESSKNWKLGETFYHTQIPQWQSQQLGHSTFGMQNNEEGDGMLTQIDVPKEKGCLKICVSTFQVFPSCTMLEAQILKVPKFQSSSKKPSFLHSLPLPKNLCPVSVFYCVQTLEKEVMQIRDLSAGLLSHRGVPFSLVSNQVLAYKFLFWLLETCSQQESCSSSRVCAQTSQLFSGNEIGLKKYSWRGRPTILVHF